MDVLLILFGIPLGILIILGIIFWIRVSIRTPKKEHLGNVHDYKSPMLGSSAKSKNNLEG